ncbi:MAG: hypothetical protein AB7S44_03085 [Spirochaetales bacterium]
MKNAQDIIDMFNFLSTNHKNEISKLIEKGSTNTKDFYYNIGYDELCKQVVLLSKNVDFENKLNIYKLILQLTKLFKDGHTYWSFNDNRCLPFQIKFLKSEADNNYGYYITNNFTDKDILFNKVIKINGLDIDEVVDRIEKITSGDSVAYVKSEAIKNLSCEKILRIVGVTPPYIFSLQNGNIFSEVELAAERLALDKIYGGVKYYSTKDFVNQNQLIFKNENNKGAYYSIKQVAENIFGMSICRFKQDENYLLKQFYEDINALIKDEQFVIIDLRENFGGHSIVSRHIAQILIDKKTSGYILVNGGTMSASIVMTEMLQKNGFITVGTATGNAPIWFGGSYSVKIDDFGTFTTSQTIFDMTKVFGNTVVIMPNVIFENSIEDYKNGSDKQLEFCLKKLSQTTKK